MKTQKGFIVPLLIAIIAVLAIGGGYAFVRNKVQTDARPIINALNTEGGLIEEKPTFVLEEENKTALGCYSAKSDIETAYKQYGLNLSNAARKIIRSSVPNFDLDSVYPLRYECGGMVGCWKCLINNVVSKSSWVDKNNSNVMYTVNGRRVKTDTDVEAYSVQIKVDNVPAFSTKDPFVVDSNIAKYVTAQIKKLTFINDFKLKEIDAEEYALTRYQKQTEKYYGDSKLLGISARALVAKLYVGDKKTNYASNAWITPPGGQPGGFPTYSYFQSSFPETPKQRMVYYDYDNDGIMDERNDVTDQGYIEICAKMLLKQEYTLEELNKAQEWRGQKDIFEQLGMSAIDATISIPNSTQQFSCSASTISNSINYDLKFENNQYDIDADISNVLIIEIRKKGDKASFSY